MNQVVVITGGSSGIGLATACAFRARGDRVYELSRRDTVHNDGIVHISADVTREEAVSVAFRQVAEAEGRVDILVCNAGFGISGAAEFTGNGDAKRLLEVNLFGAVNAVKAALPIMRAQRGGKIICISSIAGLVSIPFQAWYSVSKAAVLSYAAALRDPGLCHPARRYPLRLYRQPGKVPGGRRCLRWPYRPLRCRDGA